MSNLWLRIKVWTKVILIVLIVAYVLTFTAKNSERFVNPWIFFHREPQISVLTLALFCLLLGVVGTFLVGTTLRTVKQVRELREKGRQIKTERELSEMKAKASRLQTKTDAVRPASAAPVRVEPIKSDAVE